MFVSCFTCQVYKKVYVAYMFSAQVMSLSNFLYYKLHYQDVNKLWVNFWLCLFLVCRAFNIFQVYQYLTIYRWYFLLY